MAIRTVLVANRGEIAVRIVRAARELGMGAIVAHSPADADSLAVRLADGAVEVGQSPASKSYLNIEAILAAAAETGADAIHPGYGFLAENADFADAVEAAGLIFVGPSGETIRLLGDKVAAREAAAKAGVPTAAGSSRCTDSPESVREAVGRIGFPVLIKAAAGGGGRGIRVANDQAELERLLPQASAEARAAFGDGGLYLEKFIRNARHVEVQVLGDGEHVVHCFERECSLQRRRQKVWEEAPAVALPDQVREDLCASAVALASSVRYRGAGTLEFLHDEDSGAFFFLEMNTRIQVEHPVTECITGIDLVREMLAISDGKRLRLRQDEIARNGHAIECRINAEDPEKDFLPCPGIVESLSLPGGPGVRFDTMLYPGCTIPPFYDSLLGKLIVWDESRERALGRLERALRELDVTGVKTTKPLHQALVADKEVRGARVHTEFLEPWLEERRGSLEAKRGGNHP